MLDRGDNLLDKHRCAAGPSAEIGLQRQSKEVASVCNKRVRETSAPNRPLHSPPSLPYTPTCTRRPWLVVDADHLRLTARHLVRKEPGDVEAAHHTLQTLALEAKEQQPTLIAVSRIGKAFDAELVSTNHIYPVGPAGDLGGKREIERRETGRAREGAETLERLFA